MRNSGNGSEAELSLGSRFCVSSSGGRCALLGLDLLSSDDCGLDPRMIFDVTSLRPTV